MQRSNSLTLISALLILTGIAGIFSGVINIFLTPQQYVDEFQRLSSMGATFEPGRQMTMQYTGSPEQVRDLLFEETAQNYRIVTSTPYRLRHGIYLLLGLAAMSCGLGTLVLAPWAGRLIPWLAAASLLFTAFLEIRSFVVGWQFAASVWFTSQGLSSISGRSGYLIIWLTGITLIVWNVFLIRFFSRSEVATRFQASGRST